jgi:Zn-dependent protease/CBS domain-containing protein
LRSQLKLGRIGGIEIGLHYSWFIIAVLIAFSLASHLHGVRPDWKPAAVWVAAVITALLFFCALLAHELAHSMLAKSRGLTVRSITLFALGGVSHIESEASDAKSEFWIAFVGPLTSLAIGFGFLVLARLAGWTRAQEPATPVLAVLVWLGYINIALAGFNMIPGYPLDGGRVLRALVWWISGSAQRSTRIAARVGQAVAFLFILLGLYRFWMGANLGGLWLAFIGWFLLEAARSSYVEVGLRADLANRRVVDIMERDCQRVEGYLSLRDFIDEYLLHSASRCFLVVVGDQVAGLVTPEVIKKVSRENWAQTSVQSVMQPLDQLRTISADTPAWKALEFMRREGFDQLAVISNGKLQGIFSRGQVLRFLEIYSGLAREGQDRAA